MPTEPGVDHSTETLVLLWAIRELGVVDALVERAGTAAEISAETDLSPGDAERLLTVCSDLSFVHPVDGEYELTNRALGFLAKRDLRSIGALPHELDVIDGLIRLPDRLTDGSNGVGTERPTGEHTDSDERTERTEHTDSDERRLRNRLGATVATDPATVRARVTAAVREAPSADRVLLIDDGAGVYASEFVARGRAASVLTSPDVIEVSRALCAARDVDLVACPPADAKPAPLVYGVDVLSEMTAEEARMTVHELARSVTPKGVIVLVEPVRDRLPERVVTALDARRLATGGGRCHPEAAIRDWFAAADLDVTLSPIPGDSHVAIVARPERTVLDD